MENYSYDKKPAFFRVIAAEAFFEADASVAFLDNQQNTVDVDAELDALLSVR